MIDQYLPNNKPADIKVYEQKNPGQDVASGFFNGTDICLWRVLLPGFMEAANVYIHEKAHQNTEGAADAAANYRNYLTFALSNLAVSDLKVLKPDLFAIKE